MRTPPALTGCGARADTRPIPDVHRGLQERIGMQAPPASIAATGDSIARRAAAHMELVFRTLTRADGGEIERDHVRWITREAHPMGNVVIFAVAAAADVARAAAGPLVALDVPSCAIFPQGADASTVPSLAALGFADAGAIPAMAVDIDALAPTALPSGYAFARATGGPSGEAWAIALAAGYGLPLGLGRRFAPPRADAGEGSDTEVHYFAIVRDGRTVATSMLFLADGLAGVYCVATLADERGKGLGAHVTAQALRVARDLGYRVGVLQSSAAGHGVYRRLGFADVSSIPMVVRLPAAAA